MLSMIATVALVISLVAAAIGVSRDLRRVRKDGK